MDQVKQMEYVLFVLCPERCGVKVLRLLPPLANTRKIRPKSSEIYDRLACHITRLEIVKLWVKEEMANAE
jgi:hypothetical protein